MRATHFVLILDAVKQQDQEIYNLTNTLNNLVTSEQKKTNQLVELLDDRISTKLDNISVAHADMMVLLGRNNDEAGKISDLILEIVKHQDKQFDNLTEAIQISRHLNRKQPSV